MEVFSWYSCKILEFRVCSPLTIFFTGWLIFRHFCLIHIKQKLRILKFDPSYSCGTLTFCVRAIIKRYCRMSDVFCSFPTVTGHQNVLNEEIAGGILVFMCLRETGGVNFC